MKTIIDIEKICLYITRLAYKSLKTKNVLKLLYSRRVMYKQDMIFPQFLLNLLTLVILCQGGYHAWILSLHIQFLNENFVTFRCQLSISVPLRNLYIYI